MTLESFHFLTFCSFDGTQFIDAPQRAEAHTSVFGGAGALLRLVSIAVLHYHSVFFFSVRSATL